MALFLTFITVLSFSSQTFAISITPEKAREIRQKLQESGPLEMAVTDMCLAVGDFIMEYLTFLLKDEVTIQKIIYNQVDALNANFFTNSINSSEAPTSEIIREMVNTWYDFLGKLVIIIYMIALVFVGLKTILGGVGAKAQAQELLVKWTMGIAIFFFFPYLMRYSFDLNEALLRTMQGQYGGSTPVGSYVGEMSDLRTKDMELRSPEYVERGTYLLTLGSEEATQAYMESANKYQEKGDMMRLIRALAGITGRMIYVILWYIMLWQLLVFIYIYYKRYLIIAFLIAIFPITLIEYVIGTVVTGKQSSISSWSKEFFVNVFLQSIHAIVYGIVSSVVINQITSALNAEGVNSINWLLMIVAINFVFAGEKMLRGIINAAATESIASEEGVKQSVKKVGDDAKDITSKFLGK
jgi:hypothetical protein